MMLADERLFVAELVEPFDQLHVALEAERGVFADAVKGRDKNSELHHFSLSGRARAAASGRERWIRLRRKQNARQETDPAAPNLNDRSGMIRGRRAMKMLRTGLRLKLCHREFVRNERGSFLNCVEQMTRLPNAAANRIIIS